MIMKLSPIYRLGFQAQVGLATFLFAYTELCMHFTGVWDFSRAMLPSALLLPHVPLRHPATVTCLRLFLSLSSTWVGAISHTPTEELCGAISVQFRKSFTIMNPEAEIAASTCPHPTLCVRAEIPVYILLFFHPLPYQFCVICLLCDILAEILRASLH